MADKQVIVIRRGIGPATLLFLVFLALKLCGVINWSWWWVTAPLWIPVAMGAGFFGALLVAAGVCLLGAMILDIYENWRRKRG